MIEANLSSALEPIAKPILAVIRTFGVIVGGFFGAYVLFAFLTYLLKRKETKILKDIKNELVEINVKVSNIEEKLKRKKNKK
ncbi:MAG: hypothetical protein V1855_01395 [bacterium]